MSSPSPKRTGGDPQILNLTPQQLNMKGAHHNKTLRIKVVYLTSNNISFGQPEEGRGVVHLVQRERTSLIVFIEKLWKWRCHG